MNKGAVIGDCRGFQSVAVCVTDCSINQMSETCCCARNLFAGVVAVWWDRCATGLRQDCNFHSGVLEEAHKTINTKAKIFSMELCGFISLENIRWGEITG